MAKDRIQFDIYLLICALLLVGCGIVFVYSATSVYADERFNDQYFFLKKQIVFTFIGFSSMFAMYKIDFQFWRKLSVPILLFSIGLLSLTLVDGLGISRNGASRWLSFGFIQFEPSEITKLAIILYLSHTLSKKGNKILSFSKGIMPALIVTAITLSLLILQPDFGTCLMIALIVMLMLFIAGTQLHHIISLLLLLVPAFAFVAYAAPYRKARLLTFLDPWQDPLGKGFQLIQSQIALNLGGLTGLGLGNSKQKLYYLPASHNDFIFSLVGEELGYIGSLLIIFGFLFFCIRGFRIALRSYDPFAKLFAVGITSMITFQAIFNISVSYGLVPTKGISLPLLSYGGSSLVSTLTAIGIVLNISRKAR